MGHEHLYTGMLEKSVRLMRDGTIAVIRTTFQHRLGDRLPTQIY